METYREFDSLEDDAVDTVVSLASVSLDESTNDSLIVHLLCVEVLASDGQFARLSLLADRLAPLARAYQVEYPFRAVAVDGLRLVLKGNEKLALRRLNEVLGLGKQKVSPQVASDEEHLSDILSGTVLRACLLDLIEDPTALLGAARDVAVRQSDGLLLAYVDAVDALWQALSRARPDQILKEADSTFTDVALEPYFNNLGIATLFPPQINAIAQGATHDQNRIVALPTSSGKTLIAEFRIVAALTRQPGTKAIYVAPYRLLARQVERSLNSRLGHVDLVARDLGSGYDPTATGLEDVADVIICTPERLDALLRLATSNEEGSPRAAELLSKCSVLIFDEMHLIGRSGRGPRFEMLLARLRFRAPSMKLLGLSAASTGSDELARWIGDERGAEAARSKRPTGTLEIVWETDGSLRQRTTRRAPTKVAEIPRTRAIDDAATLILRLGRRYSPALAVCTSRVTAESLARKLRAADPEEGLAWREQLTETGSQQLGEAIEEVRSLLGADHLLAELMNDGIAFHHAGVPTHALQQIERLASRSLLRAVAATTTVAEGADLPFRAVVIPHLNFPGRTGRLERDLYLNIIGRAGRARVAVEGMVFVLDSDARTLTNVVRGSLWSTAAVDRLQGRLAEIDVQHADIDEWSDFLEFQSQVMGWLGDGSSYVENQAEVLAQQTFTYAEGNRFQKRQVEALVEAALADLEGRGLAIAGSPYKLTARGQSARLTGLAAPSVERIEAALQLAVGGWLGSLEGATELSDEQATQVSALLFEATEVFEHSLWLRREVSSKPMARLNAMHKFAYELDNAHVYSDIFQADVEIFAGWIRGMSYGDLADRAPTFPSAQSLFGGSDETKRVSDATEYIGKLSYPASWVWSAVQVLAKDSGIVIPTFVRGSIEYGLPTEGAVQLASRAGVTRAAAVRIASLAGSSWAEVRDWLRGENGQDDVLARMTRADAARLTDVRERLLLED